MSFWPKQTLIYYSYYFVIHSYVVVDICFIYMYCFALGGWICKGIQKYEEEFGQKINWEVPILEPTLRNDVFDFGQIHSGFLLLSRIHS